MFFYINNSAYKTIKIILSNFSNAITKITSRREKHENYKINDEYDVQDILYVILKSIFPTLIEEDPIPRVGSQSTKIDLLLREEKILIEVKMIKEKDTNENKFIKELKEDFESYHACQWLEKLICFIYDPYKKTKDNQNFTMLNGHREKQNHEYEVEIIYSVFEMDIDNYDEFLKERRKLVSKKIKKYYFSL